MMIYEKGDEFILVNVLEFNSFDLYLKEDPIEINQSVKYYYDKLLDEYFLGAGMVNEVNK